MEDTMIDKKPNETKPEDMNTTTPLSTPQTPKKENMKMIGKIMEMMISIEEMMTTLPEEVQKEMDPHITALRDIMSKENPNESEGSEEVMGMEKSKGKEDYMKNLMG